MNTRDRSLTSMDPPGAMPDRLSVVVAAQDARATVSRCLEALDRQRSDGIAEVILVDNSRDGTAAMVRRDFPWVRVVPVSGTKLVPELWGIGLLEGTSPIVGLLTAQTVPGPTWARAHLRAHRAERVAAVGGPIARSPDLPPLDEAVYWLRFARWNLPSIRGSVLDVAGDNASYRLDVLQPYRERIRRDGFWENEVNHELRQHRLAFFAAQEAECTFVGGTAFRSFARQRLIHGRRFGAGRIAGVGRTTRILRIVTWPGTPIVFFGRLFRQAQASGATRDFIRALPLLGCCLAAWSIGELLGYLGA
jgi:hypothetical protein